jgi:hypothetical protein
MPLEPCPRKHGSPGAEATKFISCVHKNHRYIKPKQHKLENHNYQKSEIGKLQLVRKCCLYITWNSWKYFAYTYNSESFCSIIIFIGQTDFALRKCTNQNYNLLVTEQTSTWKTKSYIQCSALEQILQYTLNKKIIISQLPNYILINVLCTTDPNVYMSVVLEVPYLLM